jgi:hypothetical protein
MQFRSGLVYTESDIAESKHIDLKVGDEVLFKKPKAGLNLIKTIFLQ